MTDVPIPDQVPSQTPTLADALNHALAQGPPATRPKPRRPRREFSTNFKTSAVLRVLDQHQSIRSVSDDLHISRNSLELWIQQARATRRHTARDKSPHPTAVSQVEHRELERLKREVDDLRALVVALAKRLAFHES